MASYKGHEYEIVFCDPKKDWGERSGLFCIDCAVCSGDDLLFFDTYAAAEAEAKRLIDAFVETVPKTKDEWIWLLNNCIVFEGEYEASVDEQMAWEILMKAAAHLEAQQ